MDLIFDHVTSKIRKIKTPQELQKKFEQLEPINEMAEFQDQIKTLKKKINNLKENLNLEPRKSKSSNKSDAQKAPL